MKPIPTTCADCGGTFREGFTYTPTQGGPHQPTWVKGVPERSRWTGLKLKGRDRWLTTAWRCDGCGLVRLYAREHLGPK